MNLIKNTAFALSSLFIATNTFAADSVLMEDSINQRLQPDASTHFSHTMTLDSAKLVTSVGVVTDWWQKRPTEIRVYENNNGEKGRLLGSKQYLNYLKNVCGDDFKSVCKYPENPTARLTAPVNATVDSVIVEVDGLLSAANGYTIIDSLQLLTNDRVVPSDSINAIQSVLDNEEVQQIVGSDGYVIDISSAISFNDGLHYIYTLKYQIIDSPAKNCVTVKVNYNDFAGVDQKVSEVIATYSCN